MQSRVHLESAHQWRVDSYTQLHLPPTLTKGVRIKQSSVRLESAHQGELTYTQLPTYLPSYPQL